MEYGKILILIFQQFFACIDKISFSKAILNIIDVSHKWCKLNFGPYRGHVKSCHFPERTDARRQYFYFFELNFLEYLAGNDLDNPFG